MGKCTINHSHEDVILKLKAQRKYLPEDLKNEIDDFLQKELTQEILNDLFHLLKKYDLISTDERIERNKQLANLVNV
ncbi:hypothetical protein [Aquibacillus rhizosphaerae]|uniref:Group-specific protein n=1 Tax=Aquibacillus rhizosphaerae TaxID=3051431 RepID=A0ABT7L2S9_9BACI|nr:hypothetical protein [Aquibacillus sp. LR5S19]MDL4840179.1 hypothetical protein [Aquibacillus sp. LR5S19]